MKCNNLFICLLSIGTLSSSSLHADPVLHIKNKSHDTIQISVKQGGGSFGKLISIAKGKGYGQTLNTSLPTTIELYYCPGSCKTNLPEKLIAQFLANTKKMYLKFDGKTIIPQEGNKLTQKTTEGYSIEGNIKSVSVTKGKIDRADLGIQDPVEAAWKEFSAADAFRKSMNPWVTLDAKDDNAPELAQKVLGVSATNSTAEIKKAYHKLSLKYHPDRYQGNAILGTEATKILSNARDILMKQPSETSSAVTNKQEIIKLFDVYPKGHKAFADPIYEQLNKDYNKQTLMDVQEKVKKNTSLPNAWKQKVLVLIDAELKPVKQ